MLYCKQQQFLITLTKPIHSDNIIYDCISFFAYRRLDLKEFAGHLKLDLSLQLRATLTDCIVFMLLNTVGRQFGILCNSIRHYAMWRYI